MTETTPAVSWDCPAYGAEGTKIGALCFFSPELGERDCATEQQCAARMAGERNRVFNRITEMAGAGDEVGLILAREFASPDDLLGGKLPDPGLAPDEPNP